MINLNRKLIVSLVLIIFMVVIAPADAAASEKVGLGTTSTFAVLAGTTITNTGTTTIGGDAGGDVGLYPGTAFTGQASVTLSGTAHLADAAASMAKNDLVIAYNDAAGRIPTTAITADLGGGTTLYPGVYNSASSIAITGTLTLDAQGDPEAAFIFQAGSTLTTATGSEIKLINSARYCRVFWQVGSSATLGTNSVFVGHLFALTSITLNTGATVQGQLLARNGAVTLDSNTITNGLCAGTTTPPITPVYPPLIKVTETPVPLTLPCVGGSVAYTYEVTNPGMVALSNVSVTDDQISQVSYVSGDVNSDNMLQPGETWKYTATTKLMVTTTNTATATGSANGTAATDIAYVTVVVAPPGQIPVTATPWYNILLIGFGLIIIGAFLWSMKKVDE